MGLALSLSVTEFFLNIVRLQYSNLHIIPPTQRLPTWRKFGDIEESCFGRVCVCSQDAGEGKEQEKNLIVLPLE